MVNDQDGKENHHEDDGHCGSKYGDIPKSIFFMPHIDEKDELDNGLKKGKTKNSNHSTHIGKTEKLRLNNNKEGNTG